MISLEDNQALSGLDLSSLIDTISKNPELINVAKSMLASPQKSSSAEASSKEENESETKSITAGLSDLSSILSSLRLTDSNGHCRDRDALLKALRPYLSSSRRETLDRILSIEKLGTVLASLERGKGTVSFK